jgi:hypothetical protein
MDCWSLSMSPPFPTFVLFIFSVKNRPCLLRKISQFAGKIVLTSLITASHDIYFLLPHSRSRIKMYVVRRHVLRSHSFLRHRIASTYSSMPASVPSIDDWARSDKYHNAFLIPTDPATENAARNSREKGLPEIAVSAAQGKFLKLLAQSIRAKRILELGTLGGYVTFYGNVLYSVFNSQIKKRYSTIWLARAVPEDGKVVTCEISEAHAEVSVRALFERSSHG